MIGPIQRAEDNKLDVYFGQLETTAIGFLRPITSNR